MESSQTNTAESPASANGGTVDTECNASPTPGESRVLAPSLPPGFAASLGLEPRRKLSEGAPVTRLASQDKHLTCKEEEIAFENGALDGAKARCHQLAVDIEKLKAEKAQVEREKRIAETKNEVLEAEVRHQKEVIERLREVLKSHRLL
ncbi:uncharacterized protein FSUBG_12345 [Fusarium subglutinans]|uniref:Uncharacterized protein n=1 Tax=Gibberella subglutinans TaxID=42677 RepID=A0A8H5NZZ2_GIBSU|nr:uncharacterized protein FSUBG_12345 [Fusarium subglutinans]KAF5585756.1 hypothetical protein FSUBG_12345 [Fusarium subglutinans]